MDNKLLEYHISKGWVIFIFIFYLLIIIVGLGLIPYILISKIDDISSSEEVKMYTLIMSILSSTTLTSVRYSQKLYKACINKRVSFVNDNDTINIGNIMYFMLRPIYAAVFTLIFVVCMLGGFMFLMNGLDFIINERVIYFSAIVSSFIGYSIGSVIDMFEIISKDRVNKIIK